MEEEMITSTIPEGLRFKFFAPAIVKANVTDDSWIIRGYAATVDLDRQNDVIAVDALTKAVKDLKENTTVFYEHKHDQFPVGRVLDAGVDEKGLWVEVLVSKTAKDIWTLIQEGVLNKFSIGGKVISSVERMDKSTGQHYNYITNMELFEVSVVGLPANPAAEFSVVGGIRKALDKKETLKTALNILEGGKNIMEKNEEKSIEKSAEETKVEKVEEPTEVKKEEVKAEETIAKKEEEPKVEEVLEKKEEPKIEETLEKKEEIKKVDEEVNPPAAVVEPKEEEKEEEEMIDLAAEFAALKTANTEVKESLATILTAIADLKVAVESLGATKEETMKSIKEAKFDLGQIEEMVCKVFDTRVGKIRLVPSRKGTIVKTDLELNGSSEDLNSLVDEESFNKLDATQRKEVIKKGLLNVFKS